MINNIPNDSLFNQQWHLNNTGQSGGTSGADINISDTWDTVTGKDVVVGVIDDGFQYSHPDLTNKYRSDLSYDFVDDDSDPNVTGGIALSGDTHGTAVAGIIAAEGNNGIGISGVAPNASFAGLRTDFGNLILTNELDEQNAAALSFQNQEIDIYNASWGIEGFYEAGESTTKAIETGILEGRAGLGNIYVFSAGNEGEQKGNVNYNALANSRYTIAVGAVDHNGVHSPYSNPGASLLVSAYANGDDEGLTTTDLIGNSGYNYSPLSVLDTDYTEGFSGTSASAPVVSGVVALMLEANPNLTWRDVQHILVETAAKNDLSDPGWVENGAGNQVNHKYGFGVVDATAAVEQARSWQTVAPEAYATSEVVAVDSKIPDNDAAGLTSSVNFSENINIEWVEITASPDLIRNELDLVLTSPNGTESILSQQGSEYSNEDQWVFTSARHWGELAAGDWSLTVIDRQESPLEKTWNSDWQIKVYGTSSEGESGNLTELPEYSENTVYRFYEPNLGTHLYTASEQERNYIHENLLNYNFEGAVYNTAETSATDTNSIAPVYRFLNLKTQTHLYTADEKERNSLENDVLNFTFEGEVFSAYNSQVDNSIPVHRFFNNITGTHFYTSSDAEKETVENQLPNYQYEDIAYYVPPLESATI